MTTPKKRRRLVWNGDIEAVKVRVLNIRIGGKWFSLNSYEDNTTILEVEEEAQDGESPAAPAGSKRAEAMEGGKP